MNEYDSEEYISKVMRIEHCSRDKAINLIKEFEEIDQQPEFAEDPNVEKRKARYVQRIKEKRCIQCGRTDEKTLSGGTRCDYCRERARISTLNYYQRKRRANK